MLRTHKGEEENRLLLCRILQKEKDSMTEIFLYLGKIVFFSGKLVSSSIFLPVLP